MKRNIIILVVLILCLSSRTASQFNKDKSQLSKMFGLQKAPDLNYEELLQLQIFELTKLGDAFLFHGELEKRDYNIEYTNDQVILNFNNYDKKIKSSNSRVIFVKKVVEVNGTKFNTLEIKEPEKLIDYEKAISQFKNELNMSSNVFPMVNYTWRDKFILDKGICNWGGNYNFGKILNRGLTRERLRTFTNQPCDLFADATDGAIITFPWLSGVATKIFTVDKLWNRVIWFDENLSTPFARQYGGLGSGYGQFSEPSGVVISGPYEYDAGNAHNFDYYLFVADKRNNRIDKFTYNIDVSGNVWGWRIKPNSFTWLAMEKPHDIELHKGINGGTSLNDQNDDLLWVVQDYVSGKKLMSINAINGTPLNEITKFRYNGNIYNLNPSRISVYRSPNGQTNVLACLDEFLHAVIFFKLNPDGTMLAPAIPYAASVWQFNSWDNLTSVKFLSTNPAFGLQAYVSYINSSGAGHINVFKVNIINGWPMAEYLASYWKGYFSDNNFDLLSNLGVQNGFVDIFTMEKWDMNRGFRRYKEGIDIVAENVSDYCRNQNNMTIDLKTTNPCRLDFSAYYKSRNAGNYVPVEITSINGLVWQSGGIAYLPAGSNHITLSAALPPSDLPTEEEGIKIKIRMVPQDEPITVNNSIMITREYVKIVKSNCSTPGGGCPYLYVQDNEDLKQENNVLHRSEFPEFVNSDIEDKIKLTVTPFFNEQDSTCNLQLRELNNDYSFFDKVQLKAIDHPIGTKIGITEHNDIVLYLPNFINNPDVALLNDSDVTCSLQYDSTCNSISGDSSDILDIVFMGGQKKGFNKKMFFNYFLNKNVTNNKAVKDDLLFIGDLIDSTAIIMDLEQDRIYPINPAKDWAGTLYSYSSTVLTPPEEILFSRRENRSEVVIPVGFNLIIDSSHTTWSRNYNLTFFVNSVIYYEGFIENDLNLYSAISTKNDDFMSDLLYEDETYATMDNQYSINLKFKNTSNPIPEGWTRDYVFVTKGRYTHSEDNKMQGRGNDVNMPKIFKLHQNFPNPFNPKATIKFDLPKDVMVTVKVFDILGREVKILVNDLKKAGYHQTEFDGSNFASGVYFYRIEAGDFVVSKKMVLVK